MFSVAPMMDLTDKHARYFLRLIAPDFILYTEMITAQALKFGHRSKLLDFNLMEKPLVLQLGGSDLALLKDAAKMGEDWGYDAINLNVGCPSSRVSAGMFGACLMKEPALVGDCIAAMQSAVNIPVTIKCRIGVDERDSYEHLLQFIGVNAQAGCKTFILHARKAWLKGLSPKENREIPPLQYEMVSRIKNDFPGLTIIGNGGLNSVNVIKAHLSNLDGVMIGRSAYYTPYFLAECQQHFFPERKLLSREEVIEAFLPYFIANLQQGVKPSTMTRHLLGLYHGCYGGAKWRRDLSGQKRSAEEFLEVFNKIIALKSKQALKHQNI